MLDIHKKNTIILPWSAIWVLVIKRVEPEKHLFQIFIIIKSCLRESAVFYWHKITDNFLYFRNIQHPIKQYVDKKQKRQCLNIICDNIISIYYTMQNIIKDSKLVNLEETTASLQSYLFSEATQTVHQLTNHNVQAQDKSTSPVDWLPTEYGGAAAELCSVY